MTNPIFFQLLDHKHSHELVLSWPLGFTPKPSFLVFFHAYLPTLSVTASRPPPLGQYLAQSLLQHPRPQIATWLTLTWWFWLESTPQFFPSTFQTSPAFHNDLPMHLNIFYPTSTPQFLWCVLPCAFSVLFPERGQTRCWIAGECLLWQSWWFPHTTALQPQYFSFHVSLLFAKFTIHFSASSVTSDLSALTFIL